MVEMPLPAVGVEIFVAIPKVGFPAVGLEIPTSEAGLYSDIEFPIG